MSHAHTITHGVIVTRTRIDNDQLTIHIHINSQRTRSCNFVLISLGWRNASLNSPLTIDTNANIDLITTVIATYRVAPTMCTETTSGAR